VAGETKQNANGSGPGRAPIGDHDGMRHFALALLLAACGPDHVSRTDGRPAICAAMCGCETDRAGCEAACITPDGVWPVWPSECELEIANCVIDAEGAGECAAYAMPGPFLEGTQAECAFECAAGER
jgi:hypothetical protein